MTTENPKNTPLTYHESGVNIDAGQKLAARIGVMAKKTHRAGVMSDIGGFAALFDLQKAGFQDPVLVSATDGVGTKLRLAIDCNQHHTIGIDLVAMCVNDILVQNAVPLFFLDYFACAQLDNAQAEAVIAGIIKGCEMAGCALIGGETAEMPGMYRPGDYDLAGFAVGAAERQDLCGILTENHGFDAIALPSSGLHSNGYSLVHRVLEIENCNLFAPAEFASESQQSLAEILLTPTRIYRDAMQTLGKHTRIEAACHITGGGFYENLPRILRDDAELTVDRDAIPIPPVFHWLAEKGNIDKREMYRTFNMGIGMVIFTRDAEKTMKILREGGESPAVIGTVTPRQDASMPQIRIRDID